MKRKVPVVDAEVVARKVAATTPAGEGALARRFA
jgi:hypothetical protein